MSEARIHVEAVLLPKGFTFLSILPVLNERLGGSMSEEAENLCYKVSACSGVEYRFQSAMLKRASLEILQIFAQQPEKILRQIGLRIRKEPALQKFQPLELFTAWMVGLLRIQIEASKWRHTRIWDKCRKRQISYRRQLTRALKALANFRSPNPTPAP